MATTHKMKTTFELKEGGMYFNDALEYIIGKKALYTIVNERTGNRFTFKTKEGKSNKNFLNIHVLTGPDNTSNYSILGYIGKHNWNFQTSQFSTISTDAQSFKVFQWVYNHLRNNTLPDYISVYHHGKCSRCGRNLTVPHSIEAGIGPECMKQRLMGRK